MLGYNRKSMYFDNNEMGVICRWFQNIREFEIDPLPLKEYKEGEYDCYDHFAAINIDKLEDIPDYDGIIGVPVSFLDVWNPEQFELVYASDYIDDVLFSSTSVRAKSSIAFSKFFYLHKLYLRIRNNDKLSYSVTHLILFSSYYKVSSMLEPK